MGAGALVLRVFENKNKIGRGRALLCIEQAGKGAAEKWTPRKCDPERAPAESLLKPRVSKC